MPPRVKDEHVRFILPSVGVLGLYLGGFLGLALFSKLTASQSAAALLAFSTACALLTGGAVLLAVQIWLWPVGRAATTNRMLKAWGLALPLCWAIIRVLGEHEFLAGFLQNLVLWTAGLASVVIDERKAAHAKSRRHAATKD